MPIFNINNSGPTASELARGFLLEGEEVFRDTLARAYDDIQRFWYRNRDGAGAPALEGSQPTGVEVLQAMGVNAKAFIEIARARAVMLLTIQSSLGLSGVVEPSRLSGPYNLTFNEDGSLASATLRT